MSLIQYIWNPLSKYIQMSYHERTDLVAGTEHEFTLPVGVVELTWQLVGKVIRPA